MSQGIERVRKSGQVEGKRLLCLVDGEHYPPVIEWAVRELQAAGAEIAGLLFLGGTEKISGSAAGGSITAGSTEKIGRREGSPEAAEILDAAQTFHLKNMRSPAEEIRRIAAEIRPDSAVDLSDDPVVRFEGRVRLASCFLASGVPYIGADFFFSPPEKKQVLAKPSIRIWGTNKRVGKTAVTVYAASVLEKNGYSPAIVSMGRGGPEKPEVIQPKELRLSPGFLLDKAIEGIHAASDCWEDAVLARVPTVGCRRCGGGMAGNPFISNVHEGVEIVNRLDSDIVIMEGSGPTSPPVKTDASILIVSARIPPEESVDGFGAYRIMESDLVLITQCRGRQNNLSADKEAQEIYRRIKEIQPDLPVVLTEFSIRPTEDIRGKKAFVATTAGSKKEMERGLERLEKEFGCRVTGFSANLSDREAFIKDLESGLEESDLLLTELKASSIDVGAKYAEEYGKEIVFIHNRPVRLGGDVEKLEEAVLSLVRERRRRGRRR